MSTATQCENNACATAPEAVYQAPEVNIFENAAGYVLEAELPGVSKSGLTLTVEDNELTIIGKRNVEAPAGKWLHRESREADFRRKFKLDPEVDAAKISAKLDQGVLTLTLPKAAKAQPRNITVS
jgi:HSP20 family protein